MSPYTPPSVPTTNSEEPVRVTREQILNGETTAGPLAVLLAKNPTCFCIGACILTGAIVSGLIWFLS